MSTQTNTDSENQFFSAVKAGNIDIVNSLVSKSPELLGAFDYSSFGGTALNVSIFCNQRTMVENLLDLGADPNVKSDWWAGPWNPTQCALHGGDIDLCSYLIDRGAYLGVHEVAGLSLVDSLKQMLTIDPSRVNERGGDGCMPLHFAGSTEVVDILLEYGADLNARDIDHHSTATQYLASVRPDITKYLFDRGAETDIFSVVISGDIERFDEMLKIKPELLKVRINQETFPPGPKHDVHNIFNYTIGSNTTLLHAAAMAQKLIFIEKLVLDYGVDVNETGGYDESSALHMAAWRDYLHVTKKLVELGANVNMRSGSIHNNTPAGWAIVGGSADVFCYLIDNGAEIKDYFLKDAKAGVSGEFMKYKKVPAENNSRILDKLI